MIEITSLSGEHMDTDHNEPWHFRGAISEDGELRFSVMELDGTYHTIVVEKVRPALGHPKTDRCCP